MPVDFEAGESWSERLAAAGFDPARPAVVVSTGVTMYLTKDATAATLRQIAALAPGSTLAMTFLLPTELVDAADRPGLQARRRARGSRNAVHQLLHPAGNAGTGPRRRLQDARHVSGAPLAERYFADRTDGLRPSSGEDLLLATT